MGSSRSKPAYDDALLLCKERIKHINQAIDSRYALSAAQLSYIQSLCRVGIALRQFAEATHLIESSSMGTSEAVDKSPSHSSRGSPSPSPSVSGSPSSPQLFNMSCYKRIPGTSVMTVTIDSLATHFAEDESLAHSPREIGSSWDFFDPAGETSKGQLLDEESGQRISFGRRPIKQAEVFPLSEEEVRRSCEEKQSKYDKACLEGFSKEFNSVNLTDKIGDDRNLNYGSPRVKGSPRTMIRIASSDILAEGMEDGEVRREILAEREDASEFITHRAKSFLSSMKDIEYRFLRAAEMSNVISRLLETNKIRLGIDFEGRGVPTSQITSVFNRVCCNKGRPFLKLDDCRQYVTKAIAWNRSVSSLSSPARIPLTSASKDDEDNDGSGFSEEFSMISGSHSCTLDRLHAWERKLYDEIKSCEYTRKVYNQKCKQLRHQCARDVDAGLIDKTRAVIKDLHSRLGVAIQSVQSIARRIERLRDDELQPQLVELIQGLIRMWKSMLECHHAQFITISLAYLTRSTTDTAPSEPYRRALIHLRNEMSLFSHSFSNWINAHKTYVEAISTWLQKCILQPREYNRKGRQVIFPPRQALSPPIFVICKDWLLGLKSLPTKELCDCVEDVISSLQESLEEPTEDEQSGKVADEPKSCSRGFERIEVQNCERIASLDELKAGLTRLFDRLTKFSEASLKVHEDVKQANVIASIAYATVEFY